MKTQKFGTPEVSLSWFIESDSYSEEKGFTSLDTDKGKKQLVDTILMLLEQRKEIRIGTDGECLILEANESDSEFTDASYQYINDDCEVMLRKEMPDNTYQYFFDDEEYQEILKEFLKEHSYYKQNDYGRWYDVREQEEFEKLVKTRDGSMMIENGENNDEEI